MTREQELISAFTKSIKEIGVPALKRTSMFGRALGEMESSK